MDAERTQVIQKLREHLVDEGFSPASNEQAIANFRQYGHVEGNVPDRLAGWARLNKIKILPEQKAEVLLFAGSDLKGDDAFFGVVTKFARLLQAAGVDFGVFDDEPCSGVHAYWMSYRDDFIRAGRKTEEKIAASGVKTVVTPSASSFGMLRGKYYDYGIDLGNVTVMHATELLHELIDSKKLKLTRPVKAKATYHDPCYLGRQSERTERWQGETKRALGQLKYEEPPKTIRYGTRGVCDAPREVIAAIPGVEFVEMHRVREHALCCGYGGGGNQEYGDLVRSTGGERLKEAESVGADLLVTACGFCERQFRDQTRSGNSGMRVADIIDLVFESAGLEG